jgi:hypothetical protein
MPVQCTPDLQALRFVHLDTRVLPSANPGCPNFGQTLWGSDKPRAAGVAWEWVELQTGVFVMADPLSLMTNLHLIGPAGEQLSSMQMTLYLNQLVHRLPWQDEVLRALECDGGLPQRHH